MTDSLISRARYYLRKPVIQIGLIFFLLSVIAPLILFFVADDAKNCGVYIEASGKLYYSSTLDDSDVIFVPGPLGETEVRILNNAVYVESSPCPHKICEKTGTISEPGEVIICYPNKVVITIVKIDDNE